MKKIFLLCCIGLALCSCEREPEKEGTYYKVSVVASRRSGGVDITWYVPYLWKNMIIVGPIPDAYEVYLAKGSPDDFTKIARFSNSDDAVCPISNLTNGTSYFAFVKSLGEEAHSSYSDTVMFIPSEEHATEAFGSAEESMESGSLAPDGIRVAYMNRLFIWGNGMYGQPSLFSFNTATRENQIIDTAAYFPDWSSDGTMVVFCSDEHEVNVNNRRPQQIVRYVVESGQLDLLTSGSAFNANPEFSPDGDWIAYVSDAGHIGSFEIWKMRPDGSEKTELTTNLKIVDAYYGNISLGRPSWSGDGEKIYFNLTGPAENTKGIYRLSADGGEITPVLRSGWLDVAPAVSPDNHTLAFFSNRTGRNEIWLFDLQDGSIEQVTGNKDMYIDITFNKIEWIDAETLFFGAYSSPDQQYRLYKLFL
jgi:dipeptidyl aminopeptidase/acylaminoacyl peptidase